MTYDLGRSQVVVIIKISAGDLNAQLVWRTSAVELARRWFHWRTVSLGEDLVSEETAQVERNLRDTEELVSCSILEAT